MKPPHVETYAADPSRSSRPGTRRPGWSQITCAFAASRSSHAGEPLSWRPMEDDADRARYRAEVPGRDETGLPDLTAAEFADVLASGENALAHALRRLAADLGDTAHTPLLAGFGNFAPPDPEPF